MTTSRQGRFFDVEICLRVGLWLNVALTGFKIAAGIWGNSRAMIADGIHSSSDVAATLIVWMAYRASRRPPDETHPYGHQGFETLAAVFVSLLLFITGGYMTYSAVQFMMGASYREPTALALWAAVISIVVKEAMYHYTAVVGRRENSPALISNAWDHRSDAFSSVAALLGIMGSRAGNGFLDPAAGIVIALLIIHMAFRILRENLGVLIDEPPEPDIFSRLGKIIGEVDGVEKIGDFKMRRRGSMYYIDLIIYVRDDLTVCEGHAIAEKVERVLASSGNRIFSSMVHVEPLSCLRERA